MRSCTRAAKETASAAETASPCSAYRRLCSTRTTLSRPHAAQIEAALALQAVEKLSRGPTSTMVPALPPSPRAAADTRVVRAASPSGSYVSRRSHAKDAASSALSGSLSSTLKHCVPARRFQVDVAARLEQSRSDGARPTTLAAADPADTATYKQDRERVRNSRFNFHCRRCDSGACRTLRRIHARGKAAAAGQEWTLHQFSVDALNRRDPRAPAAAQQHRRGSA